MSDITTTIGKTHDQHIRASFLDSGSQLKPKDTTQILYLLADIRPADRTAKSANALPLNISLVIDRSTSMKGERINRVKAAAGHIIEKLSSRDHISIVSFSDRAEIIVPSTQPESTRELISQLNSIIPSGGTEIFQGLAAAYREVRKVPLNQYVNHIILLTDGHTYGDSNLCLDLAEKAAQLGIGISGFGIGDEWNDSFLDSLVSMSGGQSGYIQEPEQILHLLRQRIQSLGSVYAHNTRIQFDLPQNLKIRNVFKMTPFFQPLKLQENKVFAGAIEGRTPLGILVEAEVESLSAGAALSVPMQIYTETPSTDSSGQVMRVVHDVLQADGVSANTGSPMPPALMQAVRMLNLHRLNENAWKEVEEGNSNTAAQRLDLLTRRFEEAGLNQLANNVRHNTRMLKAGTKLSTGNRMEVKYGTRLQLTSTLQSTLEQEGQE
ncbi:MAG: VWA domain-containing protein [Chloroflexota bacterium]